MAALPVIRGVSAALYPFTMTVSYRTIVGRFQNGSEQRSIANAGALISFELPYARLSETQKNSVRLYVSAAKGQFDSTGQIGGPFGAGLAGLATYFNLALTSDEFDGTEQPATQYAAPLKLIQSFSQTLSPGTPGLAFPTLASGAMSALPYTQRKIFQTVMTQSLSGVRYATAEFGGGFGGYPADGLMGWILDERTLSDADAAARLAHFVANWGMAYSFPFTDEDATLYSHAEGNGSPHYSSDSLAFKYNGPNDVDVKIGIELTFN